ncbi:hypothetical protein B0T16DRAFT_418195 [Cercophora newfieldiana]|uniref:Uncharacterized protein n=1 Tax=Cercophora newfieldiana TaxID=92897 RepID=A0AA40CKA7_9PEZI|nr:hypothetical protein B0T16DRAFT_418195 [Cercophora newfieldiana]
MVKATFILFALASSIASVSACERTCSLDREANGKCYYTCWRACSSLSETSARNNFANAMRRNGHSCTNSGAAGVTCTKTSAFGSCGSHYWNCGSGC